MRKKSIDDEIKERTNRMFQKIDKIIEKEWGKMCPDFELDCVQCRVHLIYNNFKDKIWQENVRRK